MAKIAKAAWGKAKDLMVKAVMTAATGGVG